MENAILGATYYALGAIFARYTLADEGDKDWYAVLCGLLWPFTLILAVIILTGLYPPKVK